MHKMLRVRIRDHLYKKYKIVCVENDLSLPKQTEKLISEFVKGRDVVKIPFQDIDNFK